MEDTKSLQSRPLIYVKNGLGLYWTSWIKGLVPAYSLTAIIWYKQSNKFVNHDAQCYVLPYLDQESHLEKRSTTLNVSFYIWCGFVDH